MIRWAWPRWSRQSWLSRSASRKTYRVVTSLGQAAPLEAHSFTFVRNSLAGMGIGVRPSPGFQPQRTSGVLMCFTISCAFRLPFRFGFLSSSQSWASESPSQIIGMSAGGRCQSGAPGGMWSPARFRSWWQVPHLIPGTPSPSAPRRTFMRCGWESSPWRGKSPCEWQFMQRGWRRTGTIDSKASTAATSSGEVVLSVTLTRELSDPAARNEQYEIRLHAATITVRTKECLYLVIVACFTLQRVLF